MLHNKKKIFKKNVHNITVHDHICHARHARHAPGCNSEPDRWGGVGGGEVAGGVDEGQSGQATEPCGDFGGGVGKVERSEGRGLVEFLTQGDGMKWRMGESARADPGGLALEVRRRLGFYLKSGAKLPD